MRVSFSASGNADTSMRSLALARILVPPQAIHGLRPIANSGRPGIISPAAWYDGDFTPAVQRAGTFWFRNAATTGPADFHLRFGRVDDLGFVGDWNGNGTWTPGVLRAGAKWYLKDSFTGSAAGLGLGKQTPGTPVVGDWDGSP